MPSDVVRNLGPSSSQSHTMEAIGHDEDLSPIITNIDPDTTFYLTRMPQGPDAVELDFSWMTEGLEPPGVNAHFEKEEYSALPGGSLGGASNYVQHFMNSGLVTDAQRKVRKVYAQQDEFARLLDRTMLKHAADIEYAIVHNAIKQDEQGVSQTRMTGGIPFFMKQDTLAVTVSTSDGTMDTGTTAHHLRTGDFVYFNGSTMPTGLAKNEMYFVRLDETTPATKFFVYKTRKGATEGVSADKIVPSTAGTSVVVVKNNVIDKGNTAWTLEDINDAMQMAWNRGGNPTMMVMSPKQKRRFSQLVMAMTTVNRDMKKSASLNTVAEVYESDFGVVTAESHRQYDDDRIDLMDMNYWAIRWFEHTHRIDPPKTGTYDTFQIESYLGLEGTQPLASAALVNLKV